MIEHRVWTGKEYFISSICSDLRDECLEAANSSIHAESKKRKKRSRQEILAQIKVGQIEKQCKETFDVMLDHLMEQSCKFY